MDARFVQLTATCTADFPNRVRKKERAKDIRKSNRFHLLPNMDPSTYSTDLSLVPALRNTASNTVTSTAISSQRYFLLRRSPGSARHAGTLRRQNIPARRPKSEATARGRESCVNCGNHSNHSNCRSQRLVNCSNYCDSNAVRLIGGQTRLGVPFVPGDCDKGNDKYGASTSLHERSTPRASKCTDWLH